MIKSFNDYNKVNESEEWGENGDLDYLMIVRYPSNQENNVRVERISITEEEIGELEGDDRSTAINHILGDYMGEVEQGFGKAVIFSAEEAEEMVMKLHPNY